MLCYNFRCCKMMFSLISLRWKLLKKQEMTWLNQVLLKKQVIYGASWNSWISAGKTCWKKQNKGNSSWIVPWSRWTGNDQIDNSEKMSFYIKYTDTCFRNWPSSNPWCRCSWILEELWIQLYLPQLGTVPYSVDIRFQLLADMLVKGEISL